MRGIYLGAHTARHFNYDIVYNDIDTRTNPDLLQNMLDVDVSVYDYAIATPPCNYWSHAHRGKNFSQYAMETRDLLPKVIIKLSEWGKPFIVENVRNAVRFANEGIFALADKYFLYVHYVGRHTYFTNVFCNLGCKQCFDFTTGGVFVGKDGGRQGGDNVHKVIEIWLQNVHAQYEKINL